VINVTARIDADRLLENTKIKFALTLTVTPLDEALDHFREVWALILHGGRRVIVSSETGG
jgi:hypothetical protein